MTSAPERERGSARRAVSVSELGTGTDGGTDSTNGDGAAATVGANEAGAGLDQAEAGGQELPVESGAGAERADGGGGRVLIGGGGAGAREETTGGNDEAAGAGARDGTTGGGYDEAATGLAETAGGQDVAVCAMRFIGGGSETGMLTAGPSSSPSPATTLSGNHSAIPGCQISVSALMMSRRKRSSSFSSVSFLTSSGPIRTCQRSSSLSSAMVPRWREERSSDRRRARRPSLDRRSTGCLQGD